jgi:uncharacterized protein YjbI with pentapeptide repeats
VSSIEAFEALLESEHAWQKYVVKHSRTSSDLIDLRSADLRGAPLAGRVFDSCDLTWARFAGADLDRTSFRLSKLDDVDFSDASLVEASFKTISFIDNVFTGVALREATFENCRFIRCVFDRSTVEGVGFISCELRACSGSDSRIHRTRFNDCEIHDWRISSAARETGEGSDERVGTGITSECEFLDCNIVHARLCDHQLRDNFYHRCSLTQAKFEACRIVRIKFLSCNLDHLEIQASTIIELDISRSTVARSDLSGMGLGTAVLLETAFVHCNWPKQAGRVTLLGRYIPSPSLISHPVQDIRSIMPTLRREIADAQYLVSRLGMARGFSSRLLLRLWGFTSAYGQSIARLFLMSCGVIFLHGLLISTMQMEFVSILDNSSAYAKSLSEAVLLSARAFIGLSQEPSTPELSEGIGNVVISARIWGFFALGVWVSVAANKLSKLSAE